MTVYVLNKKFLCRQARSTRVLDASEAFGLGLEEREFVVLNNLEVNVNPGDVIYINGQSGSGKSVLLRELALALANDGHKVANIDEVKFEDKPVIDQIGKDMQESIELLSRAGINDAYLIIRKPEELSDGQKYRLRLAKLFENDSSVWICDEWCAILDRATAQTVSYSAQKLARIKKKILIVATTHTDLIEELAPNLIITKRYNERVTITQNSAK